MRKRWKNIISYILLITMMTSLDFSNVFAETQSGSQDQTAKENEKGAGIAKAMSVLTIAMGTFQIYEGYTCVMACTGPQAAAGCHIPCYIKIAAGTVAVLSGVMGLQGAKKMAQNAAKARANSRQMSSLGKNADDNIKIDDSFMKDDKVGKILDDVEKGLGIPKDELVKALDNGVDPFDLLAAKGVPRKILDEARAKGEAAVENGAKPDPEKYGVLAEIVAGEYGAGGGGGGAASPMANTGMPSFDDLLGGVTKQEEELKGAGVDVTKIGLNPDVQKALDKAGVTDKTIFQMVSHQYRDRTPFMFGLENVKSDNRRPASEDAQNLTDKGGFL
jgi:hypothetical protein